MPYNRSRADAPALPTVPSLARRAAAVRHRTPSNRGKMVKEDGCIFRFFILNYKQCTNNAGMGQAVEHSPGKGKPGSVTRSWPVQILHPSGGR